MAGNVTMSQIVPESWTRLGHRPVISYGCGHYGNGLGASQGGTRRRACPACEKALRNEPADLVRIAMKLAGYDYQEDLLAPQKPITFEEADAVRIEAERRLRVKQEARKFLNPSRLKVLGPDYLKPAVG